MIAFGTIIEIIKLRIGYCVIIETGTGKIFKCFTCNINDLSRGIHVVASGDNSREGILENTIIRKYVPTKDFITNLEYRDLWS